MYDETAAQEEISQETVAPEEEISQDSEAPVIESPEESGNRDLDNEDAQEPDFGSSKASKAFAEMRRELKSLKEENSSYKQMLEEMKLHRELTGSLPGMGTTQAKQEAEKAGINLDELDPDDLLTAGDVKKLMQEYQQGNQSYHESVSNLQGQIADLKGTSSYGADEWARMKEMAREVVQKNPSVQKMIASSNVDPVDGIPLLARMHPDYEAKQQADAGRKVVENIEKNLQKPRTTNSQSSPSAISAYERYKQAKESGRHDAQELQAMLDEVNREVDY